MNITLCVCVCVCVDVDGDEDENFDVGTPFILLLILSLIIRYLGVNGCLMVNGKCCHCTLGSTHSAIVYSSVYT